MPRALERRVTALRPLARRSLGEDVYSVLRNLIIQGRLAAGTPVIEGRVASVLGVSRTPVREALKRLEYDGLLTNRPGHITRVSTVTLNDISEAYPLIGALEGLAARLATPRMTSADLRHMEELTKQMAFHHRRREIDKLLRVDTEFHGVIHSRAGNPRLKRIVRELRSQLERFEFAYFSSPLNFKSSLRRHRKLVRILARGNPEMSERTLARQWRLGMRAMERLVRSEKWIAAGGAPDELAQALAGGPEAAEVAGAGASI
jgi:DNA-binding GntR family transcriptional regulator